MEIWATQIHTYIHIYIYVYSKPYVSSKLLSLLTNFQLECTYIYGFCLPVPFVHQCFNGEKSGRSFKTRSKMSRPISRSLAFSSGSVRSNQKAGEGNKAYFTLIFPANFCFKLVKLLRIIDQAVEPRPFWYPADQQLMEILEGHLQTEKKPTSTSVRVFVSSDLIGE